MAGGFDDADHAAEVVIAAIRRDLRRQLWPHTGAGRTYGNKLQEQIDAGAGRSLRAYAVLTGDLSPFLRGVALGLVEREIFQRQQGDADLSSTLSALDVIDNLAMRHRCRRSSNPATRFLEWEAWRDEYEAMVAGSRVDVIRLYALAHSAELASLKGRALSLALSTAGPAPPRRFDGLVQTGLYLQALSEPWRARWSAWWRQRKKGPEGPAGRTRHSRAGSGLLALRALGG